MEFKNKSIDQLQLDLDTSENPDSWKTEEDEIPEVAPVDKEEVPASPGMFENMSNEAKRFFDEEVADLDGPEPHLPLPLPVGRIECRTCGGATIIPTKTDEMQKCPVCEGRGTVPDVFYGGKA